MLDTADLAQVTSAPPRVDTPLGPVTFAVQAGTTALSGKPDTTWRLANGTLLHRWRRRAFDLELLLGPMDAQIPDHFPAVTLWAAAWRLEARHALPASAITAGLTPASPDIEGGPDSGEHLDAVTLANANAVMSIGGPDDEVLEHWGSECGPRYLNDHTLRWQLPAMAHSETAELTIAVAWSEPTEEPATWMAVDIAPGAAFRQLTQYER